MNRAAPFARLWVMEERGGGGIRLSELTVLSSRRSSSVRLMAHAESTYVLDI